MILAGGTTTRHGETVDMIDSIANNELGSSVRGKLNQVIDLVARGTVHKPDDEAKTAMGDDAGLNFSVAAGVSYLIDFHLIFYNEASADSPYVTFTHPTVTGDMTIFLCHIAHGFSPELHYQTTGLLPNLAPTARTGYNYMRGWLRLTTADSGTVTLRWGPSGAGTARLKQGSWMRIIPADQVES